MNKCHNLNIVTLFVCFGLVVCIFFIIVYGQSCQYGCAENMYCALDFTCTCLPGFFFNGEYCETGNTIFNYIRYRAFVFIVIPWGR